MRDSEGRSSEGVCGLDINGTCQLSHSDDRSPCDHNGGMYLNNHHYERQYAETHILAIGDFYSND